MAGNWVSTEAGLKRHTSTMTLVSNRDPSFHYTVHRSVASRAAAVYSTVLFGCGSLPSLAELQSISKLPVACWLLAA